MHLTDLPHFVCISNYDLAIKKMVEKLKKQDGTVAIYRIGNISDPGISDIDMVTVFEDGVRCSLNPLKGLSKSDRYLFSHNLYGVSRDHFCKVQRYSFFHNYNLLWGRELPIGQNDLSPNKIQELKTQIALEYLIKMFINCSVEYTYGIVRVRGLLVLVRALSYDLEFLNISSGRFFDLLQTIIGWRDRWFEAEPDKQTFREFFREFFKALKIFLKIELRTQTFYLPTKANVRITKNMTLEPSKSLGYSHTGARLPVALGGLGRKYYNVQHRFNTFCFHIPIATSDVPPILKNRFRFVEKMKRTNSRNLPYFMPLTSSLNIFS